MGSTVYPLPVAPRALRQMRGTAFGLVLAMTGGAAQAAFAPEFSAPVLSSAAQADAAASYSLPVGPFAGGTLPARAAEGAVDQRAVRLDAPGVSTLDLLGPLRAQIVQAGYRVIYECAAFDCGGFDFRYGMAVLPEPDMHVDLGDYRYLAAERPGTDEVIGLLVSRSSQAGYVHLVQVTAAAPGQTSTSSKTPEADDADIPRGVPALPAPAPFVPGDVVVLEDLVFASGEATLLEGEYPSISALAAYLAASPDAGLVLTGHTDASGGAAANVALSEARAAAVKAALVARGIAPQRIAASGLGPNAPRAGNDTAEGRTRNRRVEAQITPAPP